LNWAEFIAAEARHHVSVAHAVFQPLAHRAQQLVARRVAERVVDVLEMIEVQVEDREAGAAAPRAREF
jgi:hypothetical protein